MQVALVTALAPTLVPMAAEYALKNPEKVVQLANIASNTSRMNNTSTSNTKKINSVGPIGRPLNIIGFFGKSRKRKRKSRKRKSRKRRSKITRSKHQV